MAERGASRSQLLNVLLIGKTGRGKSTTGNKLINANGNNADKQVRERKLKREWPIKPSVDCGTTEAPSPNEREPICFTAKRGAKSVTQKCEIIVNTATGFRVMDTKGFAPSDFQSSVYLENLQIMREVVGVASNQELIFHRVLYFLPERDVPERSDGYLQEELASLWHYCGESIFKNLVIVLTASPRSKLVSTDIDTRFEEGATEDVRTIFLEALECAIRSRENASPPPCPDIVFIPFQATSESVAEIVRNSKVREQQGINVEFRKTTCSKCASVIHIRRRKGTTSVAGAEIENGIIRVPEDSKCHPVFIPKYSIFLKILGGVVHIATLGIPQGIYRLTGESQTLWPWFTDSEEKCVSCGCAPGKKGCMQVGDLYSKGASIEVKHHHNILPKEISTVQK